MHRVAVLALDGVVPFDLSVPIEVFGRARLAGGCPAYEVRVCAATRSVDAGLLTLRVSHGLDALADADTIVVPGIAGLDDPVPPTVFDALRRAPGRLVSICVGAFVLAASGVLDESAGRNSCLRRPTDRSNRSANWSGSCHRRRFANVSGTSSASARANTANPFAHRDSR